MWCRNSGEERDMNKAVSRVLSMVMIVELFFLPLGHCMEINKVFAQSQNSGFEIDENGNLISYRGTESVVRIPDGVVEISDSAFEYNLNIQEVILPDTVVRIDRAAFADCENLTKVTLSASLQEIGGVAFYGCSKLANIEFPNSVSVIGSSAFRECSSLEHIKLSEQLNKIENACFTECESIKEITIPGKVKVIGEDAFKRCSALEKVTIEEGVEEIEREAFNDCNKLKEVVIPDSVKSIQFLAFWGGTEFRIICKRDSYAHIYAMENGHQIKKLYNLEYAPYLRMESDLGIVSGDKIEKKKSGTLTLHIKNPKEPGYEIYDAEDANTMCIKQGKVNISLPEGMTFKNGKREKVVELGDFVVGQYRKISETVLLNTIEDDKNHLEVKATLSAENQQPVDFLYHLMSYGTENGIQEDANSNKVADVEDIKFHTDEKISDTVGDTIKEFGGGITSTSEYKVGNKYYIFYNVTQKEKWCVKGIVLDQNYEEISRVTLPYIDGYELYGNVIVDENENYYVACGHFDENHTSANKTKVFCIAKYNRKGKVVSKAEYTSKETDTDIASFAMRVPFAMGECSLVIDHNKRIICNTGKLMYNGHQSNQVFYANTENMEKLTYEAPYCSHSFEQQTYALNNGQVLFLDKGDSWPRALQVAVLGEDGKLLRVYSSFHYRNSTQYNVTFGNLGGMAEVKDGYLISGVSEKALSFEKQDVDEIREGNVFIQLLDKDFSQKKPRRQMQKLNQNARIAEGTFDEKAYYEDSSNHSEAAYLEEGAVDYGVQWVTNYKGNEYAAFSKLVKISDTEVAILWEKHKKDQYCGTYYCVMDQNGSIVQPETKIQNTRLSSCDNVSFDGTYILWTTKSQNESNCLVLHKLKVGSYVEPKLDLESDESQKVKKVTIVSFSRENKSKKATVKFKKISKVSGYQIMLAEDRKFTKKKKSYITTKTTYRFYVNRRKTYYVKVRAYRKEKMGKKKYGSYSKTWKLKVKNLHRSK